MSRIRILSVLAALALSVAATSCQKGPAPVKQPRIDASRAGQMALEMYDTDHDGVISGAELDKAPALKAALPRLDSNGDGGVSADEIAARVNAWKAMQTAMTVVQCRVTLDGRPLQGAKVTFEPEPFLGDQIKTAVGTTNYYGDAAPTIAPEDRPAPNLPGGVHLGLYNVRISLMENGKETLPARYNTATILGQEVAYDDPAMQSRNMVFALKSK